LHPPLQNLLPIKPPCQILFNHTNQIGKNAGMILLMARLARLRAHWTFMTVGLDFISRGQIALATDLKMKNLVQLEE
jgi:hypothetical protein